MATATATATATLQPHSDDDNNNNNNNKLNITTQLNYLYQDPSTGTYNPDIIFGHPSLGENVEIHNTRDITIRDISGEEDAYTLDGNGFQLVHHVASEKDFFSQEAVKMGYYNEISDLVKNVTKASRVHIFDYAIRRPSPLQNQDLNTSPPRQPVKRIHIDQSNEAASLVVRRELAPHLADQLLQSRFQIINVWRPIHTILRDPLAIADALSVPDADLVPTPILQLTRRGEIVLVKYGEGHRWFYKRGMTPDQVFFIKCFDSKEDGRARRSPHSAFVDPTVPQGAPERHSIEVRCLVFHEHDKM